MSRILNKITVAVEPIIRESDYIEIRYTVDCLGGPFEMKQLYREDAFLSQYDLVFEAVKTTLLKQIKRINTTPNPVLTSKVGDER